eukprot:07028.XXX_205882_205992_1 [CDS] Oithona nana genome sequencing.
MNQRLEQCLEGHFLLVRFGCWFGGWFDHDYDINHRG